MSGDIRYIINSSVDLLEGPYFSDYAECSVLYSMLGFFWVEKLEIPAYEDVTE